MTGFFYCYQIKSTRLLYKIFHVLLYLVYCQKSRQQISLYTLNFNLSMFSFIWLLYKFSYLDKKFVTFRIVMHLSYRTYALSNCLCMTGRNYQNWRLQQVIPSNVKYKYFCYHIYWNDIKILSERHLFKLELSSLIL